MTLSTPSFRACHVRNPYVSQGQQEFFGDDAPRSGIDQKYSKKLGTRTTRLPPRAHKAKRQRASKCSRRLNASACDVVIPFRNPIRNQSRKYYGVKRHSLQAQLARPGGAPIRSTSLGRPT